MEHTISTETLKILLDSVNVQALPEIQTALTDKFGLHYHQLPLYYSYESYLNIAEFFRLKFYPKLEREEGYERIGYGIAQAYFQGKTGQVVKVLAGIMGPYNGAKQLVKNLRASLPFGNHEMEEVRPGYLRYHIQYVPGPPAIMRGILRGSLEAGGAKDISVHSTIIVPEYDVIHEAHWHK